MSRYRVEPCKVSNTLNIYGPNKRTMGYIYGARTTESLRFKRFIEAHDEIMEALRDASKVGFDITAGDFDYGDVVNLLNQVDALIERIKGEEEQ